MMFMGLVNQLFSLGGRNLVMIQLKKKKSLRILKNTKYNAHTRMHSATYTHKQTRQVT